MRKRTLILPILLALALLVTACSSSRNQNGGYSGTAMPTGAGQGTGTAMVPNTGATAPAGGTGTAAATGTTAATQPAQTAAVTIVSTMAPTAATAAAASQTPVTASQTSAATQAVSATPNVTAQVTGTQNAGSGVIGIPQTGNGGLVGLSAMMGFKVVDTSGNELGTVQDYVLNTCEANILYMVVTPAAGTGSGKLVLIPYQATLQTGNNGRVDAANRQFVVNVKASDLTDVPAVDVTNVNLEDPTWDTQVMSFWKSRMHLSLTTACMIPAQGTPAASTAQPTTTMMPGANTTPSNTTVVPSMPTGTVQSTGTAQATRNPNRRAVYLNALASKVLGAKLQDGNSARIGTVQDAAIVANSGHVQFLVVQPSAPGKNGTSLVALPMGAVNIRYQGNSNQMVFVLLVNESVYLNAPSFDTNTKTTDQKWFNYWSKYIPMTLNSMP